MGKKSASLAIAFLISLTACGGGGTSQAAPPPPTLRSIQVTGPSANPIAGQIEQLKAVATYSNASTGDVTATAVWTSSNTTVGTVSSTGVLDAKVAGQCSATARIGAVSGSFAVTVAPSLVSITVTPATPSIAVQTNQQFTATGTYSDTSTQSLTSQVIWASSNMAVATVSTTAPTMGLTAALSAGTSNISATLGTVSGSTLLTVTSATVTQIAVTPANINLDLGLNQQYTAIGTFSDGSTQDITGVAQWHSSNGSRASITVSGLATARSLGSLTISAVFGGVTGSTPLTVTSANVSSIAISPANGSIAQGTQLAFIATGTYSDGSTHDLSHVVTWSSDNTAALTIGSSNGLGNGLAAGQANVTATLGSLTTSVPFTVTSATIVSIAVTPSGQSIPTGGRIVFNAVGTFSNSTTQTISTRSSWSSDNTAAATVATTSPNHGVTVGVAAGTANISASFSYAGATATGSTALTVTTATLASISMTPSSAVLAPGSSVGIAAYGHFTDGTIQLISALSTWSSSSNAVATVSPNGLVSGQSAGTVTITAQDGAISGTASVLVESASLSSIQVTPPTRSLPAGFLAPFLATGTFANGDTQNLTNFVNWTSSNSSAATISNAISTAGEATGVQPGTTTVSAVYSGQVGTASLTVTNATLASITLSPSSASIAVGATQSFTATGTFSDGTVLDITRQAAWASSTTSIATVNSAGVAQAVASGTSTISAAVGNVSGAAVLTVQ